MSLRLSALKPLMSVAARIHTSQISPNPVAAVARLRAAMFLILRRRDACRAMVSSLPCG